MPPDPTLEKRSGRAFDAMDDDSPIGIQFGSTSTLWLEGGLDEDWHRERAWLYPC
jgi:hypothetical protein